MRRGGIRIAVERARRDERVELTAVPSPTAALQPNAHLDFRHARRELTVAQRTAVVLSYLDDKTRLHRARQRLSARLGGEADDA